MAFNPNDVYTPPSEYSPQYLNTNHMFENDSYVALTVNQFQVRLHNVHGNDPTSYAEDLDFSTAQLAPFTSQREVIPIHFVHGVYKVPGKTTWNDVSWTVNWFCEPDIIETVKALDKSVYNPRSGKQGTPSIYAKTLTYSRFDGQGMPRAVCRARGVWLGNVDYGQNDMVGGSVAQIQLTLTISMLEWLDRAEFGG